MLEHQEITPQPPTFADLVAIHEPLVIDTQIIAQAEQQTARFQEMVTYDPQNIRGAMQETVLPSLLSTVYYPTTSRDQILTAIAFIHNNADHADILQEELLAQVRKIQADEEMRGRYNLQELNATGHNLQQNFDAAAQHSSELSEQLP